MKKQSLIQNYIYQYLYQVLILAIPFILSPYLTRTLCDRALGTYTYVNSIAYYFVIAANLGIGIHGKRAIARAEKVRETFWSLFAMHAVISVIAMAAYAIFILVFVKEFSLIYWIEFLYVLSALFDITWLFYGLENFRSVVIKNTFVKVLECVLIFIFVKTPSDLWKYTAISASALLAGQMVLLPQAMVILPPVKFHWEDMKQHIKPLFVFSIAIIATTLYTVFDKTLLGILSTKENVAYYEYSNRIIALPKTFVEIVSSVMFPRACKLAAEGKKEEQNRYIDYSFIVAAFIGIGSVFGLWAIARPFAVLYYGKPFAICGNIIIAMSPLVYIIGAGKILRSQYMIPNGMDKEFNFCIIVNAIINLILSWMLIPQLGVYGAVVGTIGAEVFGFSYQLVICRKYINYSIIPKTLIPFSIIGAMMFGILMLLSRFGLLVQVSVGGLFYCIVGAGFVIATRKDVKQMVVQRLPNRQKTKP